MNSLLRTACILKITFKFIPYHLYSLKDLHYIYIIPKIYVKGAMRHVWYVLKPFNNNDAMLLFYYVLTKWHHVTSEVMCMIIKAAAAETTVYLLANLCVTSKIIGDELRLKREPTQEDDKPKNHHTKSKGMLILTHEWCISCQSLMRKYCIFPKQKRFCSIIT